MFPLPDNIILPKEYEVRNKIDFKNKSDNNAKQLQTAEDKVAERLNADHDSLFPQYEYFNEEQRKAMADVVANNETSIECKFTPGAKAGKFGR